MWGRGLVSQTKYTNISAAYTNITVFIKDVNSQFNSIRLTSTTGNVEFEQHVSTATAQSSHFPSQTSRTAEMPHGLISSRNNLIVLLHVIVHTHKNPHAV